MRLSDEAAQSVRAPLTAAIVKHRNILWIILLVVFALAFNGRWRVGRDSPLYRGLGHSLASGHGYHFGSFGSHQIYPGLPVLLAGLEKIFGQRDLPPILMMHLFALGCLILTYKLVNLRYPRWIAVIVTFATGMNGWFLQLTNEILADIPFLFGLLLALYGWERLRLATQRDPALELNEPADRPGTAGSIICLAVGLLIAASMRPTFWIVAICWVLVCIGGLLISSRRRFYAICLGILILAWAAFALVDPRVRGFHPLAGGYEQDAITALGHVWNTLVETIPKMLCSEFAYGFFGAKWAELSPWWLNWLPFTTPFMSAAAILASLLLLRRNPLWTLLVLATVAVTLLMSPVPRYYVMIAPLLMLAWMVLTCAVARALPHRWLEVALVIGIGLVVVPNFAWCCKVIGEQRHWHSGDEEEFEKWDDVQNMAVVVHELVPPDVKVIAPGASIMSYLSGRQVVSSRDILPENKSTLHYPAILAGEKIRYAVFPSRLYRKGERIIRELMDRGVIVPTERVAKQGDIVLAKVRIDVPPPGVNWHNRPVTDQPMTAKSTASGTTRPSTTQLARKKRHELAARKIAASRKAKTAIKTTRTARKKRHEAAVRKLKKKLRQQQLHAATSPTR